MVAAAVTGMDLLRTDPRRFGPVSRRRFAMLVVALAVQVVAGALMVGLVTSAPVRAGGLSLVFPGGGFLYEGRPLMLALWIALAVLSVVLWWGICAWWGVPLMWWAGAGLSASLAGGPRLIGPEHQVWSWSVPVVAALAAVTAVTPVVVFERNFREKRERIPELNTYLSAAPLPVPAKPMYEPTEGDDRLLEWALQMAMQPVDRFRGFDWGEQFHGPTCLRYQLNFLGWALSLFAVNYVPNALCTVEPALRNLIAKQTDRRVWRYWRTLNRIGNMDGNPDPIVRDNIMFNAYLADQINLYEAATGSEHFDQPGSLTFEWDEKRVFQYDHHSVAEAVKRNFDSNTLGLYPCEPGWVFTWCNVMGAQALKGHDRRHGSNLWAPVEPRWRHGMIDEMLRPDGHFPHIRSKLVGLSFDTGEVPGNEYYLAGTNRMLDVAPDLAVRGTLLAAREGQRVIDHLSAKLHEGVLDHDIDPRLERNTRIRTAVLDWTGIIALARMLGAGDLAAAAVRRLDATCSTGEAWPARPLAGGAQTMGVHAMTRWGTPMDTVDLSARGYVAPVGPLLVRSPWPDAVVTCARSTDGHNLSLALAPTVPGKGVRLSFAGLVPNRSYELLRTDSGMVEEPAVVSDQHGCVDVTLVLDRRFTGVLAPSPGHP